MNKDYYFSHDYHASQDEKIIKLIKEQGWEGYGLYWGLIERLHKEGGWLSLDFEAIAYDMRTHSERIANVVQGYGLFRVDNARFTAARVLTNLEKQKDKSEKARKSAQALWIKRDTNEANAKQSLCERNAIKESKEKESKEKESKEKESKGSRSFTSNPPTTEILNYFKNRHLSITNKVYIPTKTDSNKLLVLCEELGEEEVKDRMERFFKTTDKYILERGFSVGIFLSQINFLNEKPKKDKWNDLN